MDSLLDKPKQIAYLANALKPVCRHCIARLLVAGYSAEQMGDIFKQALETSMGVALNEIADMIDATKKRRGNGNV